MFSTNPVITGTAASAGVTQAVNLGGATGALVIANITAGTGTSPTLTVTIKGLTPDGNNTAYSVLASTAQAAGSATVFTLLVHPAATASANVAACGALPNDIQLVTAIGGTTPAVTYTISVVPMK